MQPPGREAVMIKLVYVIERRADVAPADFQLRTAPLAGNLVAGASVQVPFTEGAGTVAHDISGNHNDCVFGAGQSAPASRRGVRSTSTPRTSSNSRCGRFAPGI